MSREGQGKEDTIASPAYRTLSVEATMQHLSQMFAVAAAKATMANLQERLQAGATRALPPVCPELERCGWNNQECPKLKSCDWN